MIKLKDFAHNLNENEQESTFKYALVTKDGKDYIQETPFMKCRDYLNDIIACKLYQLKNNTGYPANINKIYGFELHEMDLIKPIDLNEFYLLVKFESHQYERHKAVFLRTIRNIEKYYPFGTQTERVAELYKDSVYDNYCVYKVNPLWLKSGLMTSMFTYILRLTGYERVNDSVPFTLKGLLKTIRVTTITDVVKLEEFIKYIDIKKFISNIDILLTDNITGLADHYMADIWDYYTEDCYGSDPLEHFHNKSGLFSFIDLVKVLKKQSSLYKPRYMFKPSYLYLALTMNQDDFKNNYSLKSIEFEDKGLWFRGKFYEYRNPIINESLV